MRRLAAIAAEAGAILRTIFHELDYGQASKGKEGPVTTADILSNYLLEHELSALLPEAAFLSEERSDNRERLHREWVFIVDPLDGTREFTEGIPEYSVSIGLAHRGKAILGAIAVPEEDLLVCGGAATGLYTARLPVASSFLQKHAHLHETVAGRPEQLQKLLDHEHPATFSEPVDLIRSPRRKIPLTLTEASIAVSRSEFRKGRFDLFTDLQLQPSGSVARKLGLLAAGQYDLQWSVYPKNEWDICGGVALLTGLPSYHAMDLHRGEDFAFNKPDTRSYGLLAGPASLVEELYALFRSTGGKLYHLPV